MTLAAYGVTPPAIQGPAAAAPGDTVSLSFPAPLVAGTPARTELRAAGAKVTPRAGGGVVAIPADAPIGSTIEVAGVLRLGRPGAEVSVTTTHAIVVEAPLEMALQSAGVSPETGTARVRVLLHSHRAGQVKAEVKAHAPAGWRASAPAIVTLPPGGEATAEVSLTPEGAAAAGPLELSVVATAGRDTAQARTVLLYIPKEANLLKNPGFEEGAASWGSAKGLVDQAVARSGRASIRLENPGASDSEASQSVALNQKTPCPILVQVSTKAKEVSGALGKGYSLYVDIYYTDGTPLYGRTFDFQTGSTDWQLGELYIEPAKPIRNVNVYLLLRGKSGTAWFDDVAVMEDPRRKGNVAREATASVDSSYSGYDASPVNDGVIIGEGLHWTKEAWASADEAADHFIELKFPAPRTVARAAIYWSLDAGVPRTSKEVQMQVPEGAGWKTVATLRPAAPAPQSEIRLDAPVTAERFRLLQPKGKGPEGRGNLLWVREVELFP